MIFVLMAFRKEDFRQTQSRSMMVHLSLNLVYEVLHILADLVHCMLKHIVNDIAFQPFPQPFHYGKLWAIRGQEGQFQPFSVLVQKRFQ